MRILKPVRVEIATTPTAAGIATAETAALVRRTTCGGALSRRTACGGALSRRTACGGALSRQTACGGALSPAPARTGPRRIDQLPTGTNRAEFRIMPTPVR
jgi:hypothetical protein